MAWQSPCGLKLGKRNPDIEKQEDKTGVLNYTPISLPSVVRKIFEKIIIDEVIKNLEDNNSIISDIQLCFRYKGSCSTDLLEILYAFHEQWGRRTTCNTIYQD